MGFLRSYWRKGRLLLWRWSQFLNVRKFIAIKSLNLDESKEDGNTKLFHKVAKGRKRKNLISCLLVQGGEVENFEEICNEAIDIRRREWITFH